MKFPTKFAKQPTRMKSNPTPPSTQLVACLYRFAYGCSYLTVGDLFGVAAPTAYCIYGCLQSIGKYFI